MSAIHGSIEALARSFGISPTRMLDARIDPAAGAAAIVEPLARGMRRVDAKSGDRRIIDAATNFASNMLTTLLAPVEQVGERRYNFVPGRTGPGMAPILPVRQTVELGKNTVQWQVIGSTGEARFIGSGGLADLTYTDTVDDIQEQGVGLFGVAYKWDYFDEIRAGHLGRNTRDEKAKAARRVMDEFLERVANWGNLERKLPGFWNHGSSYSVDLAVSFGKLGLTYTELLTNLAIIDTMWDRVNPDLPISGLAMPKQHRLNIIGVFGGTDGSGVAMWDYVLKHYPWLANLVEDDRLLTGSVDGGPIWQLWSASSDELYLEAAPTPLMFGPFDTDLTSKVILVQQTGGVLAKVENRIMRFNQPA